MATGVDVTFMRGAPAADATNIMVRLKPPDGIVGRARTPVDLCCIVDVSGSMGNEVLVQGAEALGLSLLDVVKHAITTVIELLQDGDRFALVAFSNDSETIFDLTPMDAPGKANTKERLKAMNPSGMTNLWNGLKTGMEILKTGVSTERLSHVILLTDGIPNMNPPRGILPMLKRLKDKEGGKLPCTISTFGFGYELDSALLNDIAIMGNGSYAFIPDAGFVGTVFVNAMTNLLVTMAIQVELSLEPQQGAAFASALPGLHPMAKEGAALKIDLGCLRFGQPKDILVPLKLGAAGGGYLKATVRYQGVPRGEAKTVESTCSLPAPEGPIEVEQCRLRLLFVDKVREAMGICKPSNVDMSEGKVPKMPEAQEVLMDLGVSVDESSAKATEFVKALTEDLHGQVAEALQRPEWYTKWGIHYLPSLMCAHLLQQCNNFKDPGVQQYGGNVFKAIQEQADEIFCKLPAPTPSIRRAPVAAAPSAHHGGGAAPVAPVSMTMACLNDRYAG